MYTVRETFGVLIVAACCSGLCRPASGGGAGQADWPRWRGPAGNGISVETAWRAEALLPEPKVLWRAQVGEGYSSVCIAGARVYTMGYADGRDSVYCLDSDTGKQLWSHSYACQAGLYPGPRATPLAANGAVYTISRNGLALCMDANSGKVVWQRDLLRDANVVVPKWGMGTSFVPEGELLLLNAGKHGMALERRTGATVWQSPKSLCGYASPVLLDANGERRMVCFGQQAVYGVQVRTGKLLWSHPWVTRLDESSADPVVWKGQVFITSVYGMGCGVLRIDGNSCRQVWLNQNMTCKFSTPMLLDGRLYGVHGNVGTGEGMLRCLDFSDGRTIWEHNLGRLSSLAVAGERFIILTEAGTIIVAKVTPEGYRELARGQVPGLRSDRDKTTKGKCWTAPVLCRSRLFIRTDRGDLVCVDLK